MSFKNLIDIGANLTHDSFASDLDQVLADSRSGGVGAMIVTGASVAGSRAALALARTHPGTLFATAGVHPHHAKEWGAGDSDGLRELLQQPEVRAAGECGLDHFRNFSTPAQQARVFREQLELASALEMPVFLHQRDAHQKFLAILDEYLPRIPRAVAHCFTGDAEELAACLDRDLYIGVTGWICDERRGHHLRELVGRIPAKRLMIETDAPYLLPRDLAPRPKSRRNEPKYLGHILNTVALATDRDPTELAATTRAAAIEFFDLPLENGVNTL